MTLTFSRRILVLDAALMAGACLIPAASHLLALPLHHLDPMRWLLLGALLIGLKENNLMHNGLLMAVLLPLMSAMVVGMPTLAKALVMVAELVTNVALFSLLTQGGRQLMGSGKVFAAMLLSLLGAKCVYYGLKALCLTTGLLDGALLGTSLALQSGVAIAFALVAAWAMGRKSC